MNLRSQPPSSNCRCSCRVSPIKSSDRAGRYGCIAGWQFFHLGSLSFAALHCGAFCRQRITHSRVLIIGSTISSDGSSRSASGSVPVAETKSMNRLCHSLLALTGLLAIVSLGAQFLRAENAPAPELAPAPHAAKPLAAVTVTDSKV